MIILLLMVMNIKITVFWDVKLCSFVDKYQYFKETAASIFRIEETHASSTSETLLHLSSYTVS
jgi:hypothetical protein